MSNEPLQPADGNGSKRVRLAIRPDVAALVRLNAWVQELHASLYPAQFKGDPDEAEVTNFFADLVEANKHSIGVFVNLKDIVGYIWIEEIEPPPSPFMRASRRLHIHHISVDPDWRGKGIGSALVDWAGNRARSAGIQELTVDHWSANSGAHGFFGRKGFEDVRIIMKRPADNQHS